MVKQMVGEGIHLRYMNAGIATIRIIATMTTAPQVDVKNAFTDVKFMMGEGRVMGISHVGLRRWPEGIGIDGSGGDFGC